MSLLTKERINGKHERSSLVYLAPDKIEKQWVVSQPLLWSVKVIRRAILSHQKIV